VAEEIPSTQEHATDEGIDAVRDPKGYACQVLHYAVEHGDVLGEDTNGRLIVAFSLSPEEFDRLATFDPYGDPN
jgi:hypothetical protein